MTDVLLVACDSPVTWLFAHALRQRYGKIQIVIERRPSVWEFLRVRARRLGWKTTIGQLLFILYGRIASRVVRKREIEILLRTGYSDQPISDDNVRWIDNVNSTEFLEILRLSASTVVAVNGTRIIKPNILDASGCKFVNVHLGITPKYRGVHGGYWACVNDDMHNFGATVHLVDAGIDTGRILDQVTLTPGKHDNLFTFPLLQAAAALPALMTTVDALLKGVVQAQPAEGPSIRWYHPTLFQYVKIGITKGIW